MTRNAHEAQLIEFCVLPDHLHCIIETGAKGLSRFAQSFKRNTTKDVKALLGAIPPSLYTGWQVGFHDECIRDEGQLRNAQRYVQENAYLHGLVEKPEDWPWTSLHFEHLLGCRKRQEVLYAYERRQKQKGHATKSD